MATTRLMPLHIGEGRSFSTAIEDIIDYVENPEKTDYGKLIYGFECDTRTADAEFTLAKRQYIHQTGRVAGRSQSDRPEACHEADEGKQRFYRLHAHR